MRTWQKIFHRNFNLWAFLYFACLLVWFHDDPFFGDAISSTSRLAQSCFENGSWFYPSGFDPGHPPTYGVLLAAFWKMTIRSLWASHLFGILWCVMLYAGFRKLSGLFLSLEQTNLTSLLVMVHPTFISQNAMVINTALLMGIVFWAMYYLIQRRVWAYTFLLVAMVLVHLQGVFFLAALAVADGYIHFISQGGWKRIPDFFKERFVVYTIPFLMFLGWLVIHQAETGWYLISPDYTDTHEANSLKQVFKGFAYCAWRFVDYGMVIPFLIYIWFKVKSRKFDQVDWLFILTLGVTIVIMSFVLKNTIAHRYFLASELLLLALVVREIHAHKRFVIGWYMVVFISLFSGNFWYYPGKTIADANVQYRSVFQCLNHLPVLLERRTAFSKAPIANSALIMYPGLEDTLESADILRINDLKLDSLPVVITSNVCAEFTSQELDVLSGFYGQSIEYGATYMNVYLNPRCFNKPKDWKLRSPGKWEQWMTHLKERFK